MNLLKKIGVGVASLAMSVSMFAAPVCAADSASAGTVADLSKAKVTLNTSVTYTGKAFTDALVKSVVLDGKDIKSDVTVKVNKTVKNAGKYTKVVVTVASAYYDGNAKSASKTITVHKAANTIKAKTYTISKGKSVNLTGKGSFSKVSGYSKISVSKAGKLTVSKKAKKGTYKVKVKAGNSNYIYTTKTMTVKVK